MAQAPNIRIDTRILPPEDRHALTACADIVLSLHRGEGFGLVLAEAMLLGKPVVATGWSGNTDFMDPSNAALVAYRLAPARDDRDVYRGLWAEPDVADAADRLRALADDPALRRRARRQGSIHHSASPGCRTRWPRLWEHSDEDPGLAMGPLAAPARALPPAWPTRCGTARVSTSHCRCAATPRS